jgi:hypothetical protein
MCFGSYPLSDPGILFCLIGSDAVVYNGNSRLPDGKRAYFDSLTELTLPLTAALPERLCILASLP